MLTHCHLFLEDHPESKFQIIGLQGPCGRYGESAVFQPTSPLVVFLKRYQKPLVKRVLLDQLNTAGVRGAIDDMEAISAELVLPLFFRCRFKGFISFGQKMSDELFSQEDIDLLLTLSAQTSLAIENASAYKRLDVLNKTLEFQVEKRTKALQRALSEKEKTQEQLIRSESLAAIGQLVAGTAHELNNPLSSSISLVQSVVEVLEKDRTAAVVNACMADLAFVDKELGRAKSIISSLLGLSRQTRTYSEAVDLNAVVKDALQVLHNQFKHEHLMVVTDFADNLPLISGNFSSLGQVARTGARQ